MDKMYDASAKTGLGAGRGHPCERDGSEVTPMNPLPIPASVPSPVPTVSELLGTYLSSIRARRFDPATIKAKCEKLNCFAEKFGHLRWNDVRLSAVEEWIAFHASWKSDNTKSNCCKIINALFNWAVRREKCIPHNPLAGLRWDEEISGRSIRDDEYRALRRFFDASFRRVMVFLDQTGARPGELAAIEWGMVNWKDKTINLERHKTRKKSKRPRVLYLSAVAFALLRWMKRCRDAEPEFPSERIFVNRRGNAWDADSLSLRFQRARDRLGLASDLTLYCFRHRFGNRCQAAGLDIRTTADLMGHASVRTTERYYLHAADRRNSLLDALERSNHARIG